MQGPVLCRKCIYRPEAAVHRNATTQALVRLDDSRMTRSRTSTVRGLRVCIGVMEHRHLQLHLSANVLQHHSSSEHSSIDFLTVPASKPNISPRTHARAQCYLYHLTSGLVSKLSKYGEACQLSGQNQSLNLTTAVGGL